MDAKPINQAQANQSIKTNIENLQHKILNTIKAIPRNICEGALIKIFYS